MADINVQELKSRMDAGNAPVMIDVREAHEWEQQHLPGVTKISLGDLPHKLAEFSEHKAEEIVLICRSGGRSAQATAFMQQQGFSQARNLAGGMLAWKAAIDPSFEVE